MYLTVLLIITAIPCIAALLLTWSLTKKKASLRKKMLPGTVLIAAAIAVLLSSFVFIHNFHSGAYWIISLFLLCIAGISFIYIYYKNAVLRW